MGVYSTRTTKRDDSEKTCYCCACNKWFHPLGITRHRAMHRDNKEIVTIEFTNGERVTYDFEE